MQSDQSKLTRKHQELLASAREISKKLLEIISRHIDEEKKSTLTKKDEGISIFLKVAALLTKLIPLEQQLFGTSLIKFKTTMKAEESQEEVLPITQTDVLIMEKFIKEYRKVNEFSNEKPSAFSYSKKIYNNKMTGTKK